MGEGKYKKIYDIGNDRVIALINSDEVTTEELSTNTYIQLLNITNNKLEPIVIKWLYNEKYYTKSGYMTQSFSSYEKYEGYVIDMKNKIDRLGLFKPELPSDYENLLTWIKLFELFYDDVIKLLLYDMYSNIDMIHAIIIGVKNEWHSKNQDNKFEVRLFLYDTSASMVRIGTGKITDYNKSKNLIKRYFKQIMKFSVTPILYEFFGNNEYQTYIKTLSEKIIEYYINKLNNELNEKKSV